MDISTDEHIDDLGHLNAYGPATTAVDDTTLTVTTLVHD